MRLRRAFGGWWLTTDQAFPYLLVQIQVLCEPPTERIHLLHNLQRPGTPPIRQSLVEAFGHCLLIRHRDEAAEVLGFSPIACGGA
ncbi:hypothetical protein HVIM_04276 [Roseomonas mucosa]|nr:hypothetical protein HVIM_04276 [Roseomonas mucosa]UZO92869.1 Hypothetical protein RMP42_04276 [Roseomonas mucosa]